VKLAIFDVVCTLLDNMETEEALDAERPPCYQTAWKER